MADGALQAALMVQRDTSARMGADRVRLLEAIHDHGSISAAARTLGLSYKSAWDAVNAMNNLFGLPLVAASPGGRSGGGATITPAGLQVIAAFAVVQTELDQFLRSLEARFRQSHCPCQSGILWSFLMKTSARNMFRCTVSEIVEGAVNAEVLMDLTDDQQLVAIITNRSVKTSILPLAKRFLLSSSPASSSLRLRMARVRRPLATVCAAMWCSVTTGP